MIGAASAELYGIRHRRSFPIVTAVWVLQIVVFAYLVNYLFAQSVQDLPAEQIQAMQDGLLPENATAAVVGSLPMFGAPVMIILGALLAAGDEKSGVIRAILSRFPERGTLIGGKIIALAVVVAIAILASFLVAFPSSAAIAALTGEELTFAPIDTIARDIAFGYATGLAWAVLGFALGIITRSLALSIAIGLLWALAVEQALHGLAGMVSSLDSVRVLTLSGASGVLADATGASGMPGGAPDASVATALLVLLGWCVVAIVASTMVFRSRDIS